MQAGHVILFKVIFCRTVDSIIFIRILIRNCYFHISHVWLLFIILIGADEVHVQMLMFFLVHDYYFFSDWGY